MKSTDFKTCMVFALVLLSAMMMPGGSRADSPGTSAGGWCVSYSISDPHDSSTTISGDNVYSLNNGSTVSSGNTFEISQSGSFNALPGFSATLNLQLTGFWYCKWTGTGSTPNATDTYTAACGSTSYGDGDGCLWHDDYASTCLQSIHSVDGSGASSASSFSVTVSWHYGYCPNPSDPNDDLLQHWWLVVPVDSVSASASGGSTSVIPPQSGDLGVGGSLTVYAITATSTVIGPQE